MIKRISALIFAVALLLSLAAVPALAASDHSTILDDSANLLSSDERSSLEASMRDLSSACDCNVIFVTVNDLNGATFPHNGTTADYADEYYDTTCGKNTDGVLFLTVLKNPSGKREFYFSTSGKCIKRFSDNEREDVFDDMQFNHNPDTHGYYDMFNAVVKDLKQAITPHLKWYMLPLAIGIGLVLALIIMSSLRSKLKSVKMERGAANYVRPGSMNLTASRDTFLYNTVSRREKPKNNGSSTHTSSGGGTHGGGGRSF